jgi:hypothetical protein
VKLEAVKLEAVKLEAEKTGRPGRATA